MLDIANYNPKTAALTTQPRLNYYKYAQLVNLYFFNCLLPKPIVERLSLEFSLYDNKKSERHLCFVIKNLKFSTFTGAAKYVHATIVLLVRVALVRVYVTFTAVRTAS